MERCQHRSYVHPSDFLHLRFHGPSTLRAICHVNRRQTQTCAASFDAQPGPESSREEWHTSKRPRPQRGPPMNNQLGHMFIGPGANEARQSTNGQQQPNGVPYRTASQQAGSRPQQWQGSERTNSYEQAQWQATAATAGPCPTVNVDSLPYVRNTWTSGSFVRDEAGRQVIRLANSSSAGQVAASISKALRVDHQAVLLFSGQFMLLKALRVLVLANLFVRQHNMGISFFVSRNESPDGPYQTNQSHYRYKVIIIDREVYDSEKRRPFPEPKTPLDADPTKSYAPHIHPPEADQAYDFSLDARQEWKRKRISEDLAFNIADMMYDHLGAGRGAAAIATAATSAAQGATAQQQPGRSSRGPGGTPSAGLQQQQPPGSAVQQQPRTSSSSMQLSADCVMAITLFAGMSLTQRRLQQEGSQLLLGCTAYRNTLKPRLDQRDGFVFEVRLHNKADLRRVEPAEARKQLPAPKTRLLSAQQQAPPPPQRRVAPKRDLTARPRSQLPVPHTSQVKAEIKQ